MGLPFKDSYEKKGRKGEPHQSTGTFSGPCQERIHVKVEDLEIDLLKIIHGLVPYRKPLGTPNDLVLWIENCSKSLEAVEYENSGRDHLTKYLVIWIEMAVV